MIHSAEGFHVVQIAGDISIVNIIVIIVPEKRRKFAALGVDIVMTSCSKMFYNRTGFIIDIDLNTFNVAVGHIEIGSQ